MKKNKLFSFVFLTSLIINAQDYSIEKNIIDCVDKSLKAQNVIFEEKIGAYEQLLISEKLLKDNSGASYLMALNRFVIDKEFNYYPSKGFSFKALKKCESKFGAESILTIQRINFIKDSIIKLESYTLQDFAKSYLKLLNAKDLEQDYYKLQVFQLFQLIDVLPKKDDLFVELNGKLFDKETLNITNALEIAIDVRNQLSVNGEEGSLNFIKGEIREYLEEYGPWSIFVLKSGPNMTYGHYTRISTALFEEVLSLRKVLAVRKYDKEYNCLTKKEKAFIEQQYPLVVKEY